MKKQKMSLEKMREVLTNVLSRDEMKEVMAGSGTCGATRCNGDLGFCSPNTGFPGCRCDRNPMYYTCS